MTIKSCIRNIIFLGIFIWVNLIYIFSRILSKNGTSLPGWIVEKYFVNYLTEATNGFKDIIIITGTNGKTTARGLICHTLTEYKKQLQRNEESIFRDFEYADKTNNSNSLNKVDFGGMFRDVSKSIFNKDETKPKNKQRPGCPETNFFTNKGGANIMRGLATSIFLNLKWDWKKARLVPKNKIAVLEIEEATLPIFCQYVIPTKLVFTNVFRDQLDMYGEIDKTLFYFSESIQNIFQNFSGQNHDIRLDNLKQTKAFETTTFGSFEKSNSEKIFTKSKSEKFFVPQKRNQNIEILINQDDYKLLSFLLPKDDNFYDEKIAANKEIEDADKSNISREEAELQITSSNTEQQIATILQKAPKGLNIKLIGFGLGRNGLKFETVSREEKLGIQKINFHTSLMAENLSNVLGQNSFTIKLKNSQLEDNEYAIKSPLKGVYNIYNILPSIYIGYNLFGSNIFDFYDSFQPVFGRGEKVSLGKSSLEIFLIKNPAGFEEILSTINNDTQIKEIVLAENTMESSQNKKPKGNSGKNLVFLINDNIADSQDTSWLWDTDIQKFDELMSNHTLWTGGSRGLDILLRLEYAGLEIGLQQNFDRFEDLITKIQTNPGSYKILATYTAMLQFREVLAKYTQVSKINQGF